MSTKTSRAMARKFAPGTRVVATDGPTGPGHPQARLGTMGGTVVRFVEGNNAQGGSATVEWDNGTTGRKSPGSLAVVEAEGRCTTCFTAAEGYEPDMGDDETTFAPGTCTTCGREMIVFTVTS